MFSDFKYLSYKYSVQYLCYKYKRFYLYRKRTKITVNSESNEFPDLIDWEDIDAIYKKYIKLADELYESGEFEGGMHHLSNALAAHVEPWRLLQCLH